MGKYDPYGARKIIVPPKFSRPAGIIFLSDHHFDCLEDSIISKHGLALSFLLLAFSFTSTPSSTLFAGF